MVSGVVDDGGFSKQVLVSSLPAAALCSEDDYLSSPTTSTKTSNNGTTNTKKKKKTLRRRQVQIVHRHGDRSPITSLKDEEYWASQLIPESMLQEIAAPTTIIENYPGETNRHKANGRGPFGKLTMLGLEQMVDLGTTLRKEFCASEQNGAAAGAKRRSYTDKDGNTIYPYIYTPDRPLTPFSIRVVSTSFARAVQSAQGVLRGLFPDGFANNNDNTSSMIATIDTRDTMTMIPDPQPRHTREQAELEDLLAVRPHLQKREDELLPLAIRVTHALHPLLAADAREATFGAKQVTKNSKVRTASNSEEVESIEIEPLAWNQLGEITKCLSCRNNMLQQVGISQHDHEAIVQHAAWRWFETFRHPRVAYLGMGTMCQRMIDCFTDKENDDTTPMTLYSAHDSTLIGLLCAFKLEQPNAWPEYGSFLMMELLEVSNEGCDSDETNSDKDLYVRFSMNGTLLRSKWLDEPTDMILLKTLAEKVQAEGDATVGMSVVEGSY